VHLLTTPLLKLIVPPYRHTPVPGSLHEASGCPCRPFDDVSIHSTAQGQRDYKCEMAVVIGQDGKNISEANALGYILGYTAGNAVSARNFHLTDISGGQFCYAKSFDTFSPIGLCIVYPSLIPDPQKLTYSTKVNGEVRQRAGRMI
jgi:2-keto-4-pentenoate hydratase/2-oxohepta-3-ene-1,7-dioic acid hydratase in catechol pathway